MVRLIAVILFLAVAGMATAYFLMGFPAERELISTANASIPSYTANTTAWVGFSGSLVAMPLIIVALFGGLLAYGFWRVLGIKRNRGGGG